VSVITITHNQEHFLENCIKGVISQNRGIIKEYLIADDCSTDDTRSIIKKYYSEYPGLIIPIYRETNLGALDNFYDVLMRCRGRYIVCIDGDDYWIDNYKLERQVEFLEKNNQYSLAGTNYILNCKEKNIISVGNIIEGQRELTTADLIISNIIAFQTAMFRRKLLNELPPIYKGEDGKLVLFFSSKGKILLDTNSITTVHNSSVDGLASRNKTYKEKVNNLIVKLKKA
ncbi:uncharacterized protein METZ01_LOCUS514679, partial [marine metagenome]